MTAANDGWDAAALGRLVGRLRDFASADVRKLDGGLRDLLRIDLAKAADLLEAEPTQEDSSVATTPDLQSTETYRAATLEPVRLAGLLMGDHETALALGLCAMSDRLRRAVELLCAQEVTTNEQRPPAGITAPAVEPANVTRLWTEAEDIYRDEFPHPRHYFGMLPSLAKIAYFERAALEAIDRAAGLPHTIRGRVVSIEEMERYLRKAVPTEITDG